MLQKIVESVALWWYGRPTPFRMETKFKDARVVFTRHLNPEWAMAKVVGEIIFFRDGVHFERLPELVCHEYEHVKQVRRDGFFMFLVKYGWFYLLSRLAGFSHMDAYKRIPYEVEAYAAEGSCQ